MQARHAELDRRAAARQAAGGNALRARHRERHLFSGLVCCAACGASYVVNGADRLGCIGRKRGTCSNAITVHRSVLERRILSGIKGRLLSAEAIEAAVEAARQGLLQRQREQARDEGRLRQELGEAQRAIANILRAIEDGMHHASMKERLSEAELAELVAAAEVVLQIPHPRIADAYRRQVEELELVLGGDDVVAAEAREVVRSLITRIAVRPTPQRRTGCIWTWGRPSRAATAIGGQTCKTAPGVGPGRFADDGGCGDTQAS